MTDWAGNKVKEAPPSMPVEILGLDEVPGAGEKAVWSKDEKSAREIAETRSEDARVKAYMPQKKRVTLRDIRNHATEGDIKDLNLIIKADVQGSLEAVRGLIDKLKHPEVNVKVIQGGVGPITEGDILLATATGAIAVGFNVKPDTRAKAEAERMKIEIRTYTIIYELIEDIEAALKGMLEPKFEQVHQGTVEIRAVFKLTKAGKVAGCHVTEGKILRNSKARVTRGKDIVFEGDIESLRNVKQDVREMTYGQDCGLRFTGWEDFKEGDIVEAYELVQID
jgi:translation initiation factor IF-2